MASFPIFLSLVFVVRNQGEHLETMLRQANTQLRDSVSDHELIVIDNASDDQSLSELKRLTGADGLPNLQVYALTKAVSSDTAAWVGLENALGDFVAVIDPLTDDIGFLPALVEKALSGADAVFAHNRQQPPQTLAYRAAHALFNRLYQAFNGISLIHDAPSYRLLSRRVINFILQHPQPAISYRHLPATGGFARARLDYSAPPATRQKKRLSDSIARGRRLLVSSTEAPMRLVTGLSLFGAVANLLYSVYVLAIALFKADVAPGWVSLSLQQSGMFFLISLVLLVLGEYILHMASLSNEGPPYHVAQEFTSVHLLRKQRLNIEEAAGEPASAELPSA